MTDKSASQLQPPSYWQIVWEGKWWILLIGALSVGFALGITALVSLRHTPCAPDGAKISLGLDANDTCLLAGRMAVGCAPARGR